MTQKLIILGILILITTILLQTKKDITDGVCMEELGCFKKIAGEYTWDTAANKCKAEGMILPDMNTVQQIDQLTLPKIEEYLDELYTIEMADNYKYKNTSRQLIKKFSFFWTSDALNEKDGYAYSPTAAKALTTPTDKTEELSIICLKKRYR